jgi:hypothetical protein
MKQKINQKTKFAFIATLMVVIVFSLTMCTKNDDFVQKDIESTMNQNGILNEFLPDVLMDPGVNPEFINYNQMSQSLRTIDPPQIMLPTWSRYMYLDRTDTIYENEIATKRFAGYLKKYGFSGVYMYDTRGIVAYTSKYQNFSNFLKILNDSGVVYKASVLSTVTEFLPSGNVTRYNNSQTDPTRRINRANLELEWWNGESTWSTWISRQRQIANGTPMSNDFYEGWYLNLGGVVDSVAAKEQVLYSDRILLHCYEPNIPTYAYANARPSSNTAGRLDLIAKGARQAKKKIDLFIIISAENTAWGASNTFTGPNLAAAINQPNPYEYIESQAVINIYNRMTPFQKEWINFKGFVWFTKRYCYSAIPPR